VPQSPTAIEPGAGPPAIGQRPAPPEVASTPAPAARLEVLEQLAAELRRHQTALAERERTIGLREAVVTTVEARVRAQLADLGKAKAELERLLGQASADEQARIAQLVKVYEAIKAKNAAVIFDPMALELLLPIVRSMRETKVAAIVAEMDPVKARALTAELARPRELGKPL
jgi:flagellar motility protein MotE (MotC chaperone)